MFAKLSALAVFLPLVSALTLTSPAQVEIGASVDLTVIKSAADPSMADFYIIGPGADIKLNVNVALDATVTLDIPCDGLVVGAGYMIVATAVGNVNGPLAQTAPFIIVDSEE